MGADADLNDKRLRRPRSLRAPAVATLMRFLAERGLSDAEIERALDYAESEGASTIRHGFVLAMSRSIYSDAELAAGARFTFDEASSATAG